MAIQRLIRHRIVSTRVPPTQRLRRRRRNSPRNLVQEYIYEIICIKILAPIFTIALTFLQRRTNNLQRLSCVNAHSCGRRRVSDGLFIAIFHFLITHFLSNWCARTVRRIVVPLPYRYSAGGTLKSRNTVAIG